MRVENARFHGFVKLLHRFETYFGAYYTYLTTETDHFKKGQFEN